MGLLNLPLSESQASKLIKDCSQATYGLNNSEFIDTNIRDSYQHSISKIEFKNPEWQNQINLLAKRVAKEMGYVNLKVNTKLYKTLLYKTGGHFTRHRDSQKEENQFGTLIIQLPSKFCSSFI